MAKARGKLEVIRRLLSSRRNRFHPRACFGYGPRPAYLRETGGQAWGFFVKLLTAFLTATLLTVAAPSAFAQSLTRGPLLQNPDGLTTTMTILWWTNLTGDSKVEYGLTTGLGQSVTVAQASSCEIGGAGACHTVRLTGLQPGTRYYYRLLTNNVVVLNTTYFHTFKAFTDTSENFFAVVGDFGAGTSGQANVANNMSASDPPLVITAGDNAYQNGTQSDWDDNVFIPEYSDNLLRRSVWMPILGNHDLNDVGTSNWANSVEIKMHALPRNAPAGQAERYFSFDQGDAHFVVMDSNPAGINSTQTNWVDADLAATTRKWKFVFLHHPPYSCANGIASFGTDQPVQNAWAPIFEKHKVDIVFFGHDHIYERSKLLDQYLPNGAQGSDGLATTYVMTGAGGQTLDSAASSDGGGPYRQPLFGSKTYCNWMANNCPNGVGGQYCSFARFQHVEVRIANNTTMTMKAIDQNNAVFDQLVITKTGGVCDNGVIESGEQCDDGTNNGSATSCCTASCTFKTPGTSCRAADGVCDQAETCTGSSGSCPADTFLGNATTCRAAATVCDVAEKCSGASASCPADGFAASNVSCRASLGPCDFEEFCSGASSVCPDDQLRASGEVCRVSASTCDAAESCTGASAACPADGFASSTTPCRAAAGPCDQAESCTGTSNTCPADTFLAGSNVCRNAVSICDQPESCTGSAATCPADTFASSSTVCRSAFSVCDVAETCTGSSSVCPGDGFASSSVVCRESTGVCDQAESCTGSSSSCPANSFLSSSTVCRASTGDCDQAETCTGSAAACPANGFKSSSTVCRVAADLCDVAENCSGASATCPNDGFASSTSICRPSAGGCDVVERCTGSGIACPADAFAADTTVCRNLAGPCDVVESCSGSSAACPANVYQPASVVCRDVAGVCDQAESCTGGGPACPGDTFKPSSAVCRASADLCDKAESCTGTAADCGPDVLHSAGVECRASTSVCDGAEVCTGTEPSCPANDIAADSDGDGTCDLLDVCPADADPDQTDADSDGAGDACDPCSNFTPVFASRPSITITRLATAEADDAMKFSGRLAVPADEPVDPLSDGVRVMLVDRTGASIVDATVPGGPYDADRKVGWKVNGARTTFTYSNTGAFEPLIQGINKLSIKTSPTDPGSVQFTIGGKNGSYDVQPANLPLTGIVVLDPPAAATNLCGEAVFTGVSGRCVYVSSGSVKCK